MRRPNTKTLVRVLDWLHSLQLEVYGPLLEKGYGCQDYDLEDILLRHKLLQQRKEDEN